MRLHVIAFIVFNVFSFTRTFPTRQQKLKDRTQPIMDRTGKTESSRRPTKRIGRITTDFAFFRSERRGRGRNPNHKDTDARSAIKPPFILKWKTDKKYFGGLFKKKSQEERDKIGDSNLSYKQKLQNIKNSYGSEKHVTFEKCSEKWLEHKLKQIQIRVKFTKKGHVKNEFEEMAQKECI